LGLDVGEAEVQMYAFVVLIIRSMLSSGDYSDNSCHNSADGLTKRSGWFERYVYEHSADAHVTLPRSLDEAK
jgi:hypothetical protein